MDILMDKRFCLVCLIVISLSSLLKADDHDDDTAEIKQGGFYVKFHKRGGKIMVSKYKTSDKNSTDSGEETGDDDNNKNENTTQISTTKQSIEKEDEKVKEKLEQAVVVDLKSMVETDNQGNEVLPNDTSKHSVDSFQSQNFTANNASVCHPTIYCHSFETRFIQLPAKFLVNLYIGKQSSDGKTQFEVDGEVHNINKNQMKLTFKVTDWKFCNETSCTKNGTGMYLSFAVKGSGKARKMTSKSPDSEEYELGKGQSIVLPTKSRVDRLRKTMAVGYPKLTTDESFTVQFDRFENEALYDPTITLDEIDDLDSNTTSTATTVVFDVLLLLAMLVCVLMMK